MAGAWQKDRTVGGRVVVVTGAGAGLGRRYALDLGRGGARVVVHARRDDAALGTVGEIVDAGGDAVAVVADAGDGDAIVAGAVAAYGGIDALVVNAGAVRDRTVARMSRAEWDDVLAVHLGGAFTIVRAAWPYLADRGGGRIVLTTSGAGLHGNVGQANYAAAKAGIVGMTKTLAAEGRRRGILVNAVAPMALTAMTDPVFDDHQRDLLRPERVSPFVLALVDPRSQRTGAVVEVGGGWAGEVRWERAAGLRLADDDLTVDTVLARWDEIADFSVSDHPTTIVDSLRAATGPGSE